MVLHPAHATLFDVISQVFLHCRAFLAGPGEGEMGAQAAGKKKVVMTYDMSDADVLEQLGMLQDFIKTSPQKQEMYFGNERDRLWHFARLSLQSLSTSTRTFDSSSGHSGTLCPDDTSTGYLESLQDFLMDNGISVPQLNSPSNSVKMTQDLHGYIKKIHGGKICSFDYKTLSSVVHEAHALVDMYKKGHSIFKRLRKKNDARDPTPSIVTAAFVGQGPDKVAARENLQQSYSLFHTLENAFVAHSEQYVGGSVMSKNVNMHLRSERGDFTSEWVHQWQGDSHSSKQDHISNVLPTTRYLSYVEKGPREDITSNVTESMRNSTSMSMYHQTILTTESCTLQRDSLVQIVPEIVGQFIGLEVVKRDARAYHHDHSEETSVGPAASGKPDIYLAKKTGLARALSYYCEKRITRLLLESNGFKKYDTQDVSRFRKIFASLRDPIEDICENLRQQSQDRREPADLSGILKSGWESALDMLSAVDSRYREMATLLWTFLGNGPVSHSFRSIIFLWVQAKYQRCFFGSKVAVKYRLQSGVCRLALRHLSLQYALLNQQENLHQAVKTAMCYLYHYQPIQSKEVHSRDLDVLESEMRNKLVSLEKSDEVFFRSKGRQSLSFNRNREFMQIHGILLAISYLKMVIWCLC